MRQMIGLLFTTPRAMAPLLINSAPGLAGGRRLGASLTLEVHSQMLWAASWINSHLERLWSQVSLQERYIGGICTGLGGIEETNRGGPAVFVSDSQLL
jgi:hypothetical protein